MEKFKQLAHKFLLSVRNHGLFFTLKTFRRWIFVPSARMENKLSPRLKMDNVDALIRLLDFTKNYERGALKGRVSNEVIKLGWVLPPFHVGSGGHQSIFRIIQHLERVGVENHVYITDGHDYSTTEEAYNMIQDHFFKTPNLKVSFLNEQDIIDGLEVVEPCDLLIATRYNTVYYAALIEKCVKRAYLIQDYEPMFFPTGYTSVMANNTYKLGFLGLCASPWLAEMMTKKGMDAYGFYLGYDDKVYSNQNIEREKNSVAFYARYQSERRAVELGMYSLELLQKKLPDLRVYLYGANDVLKGYDLQYENLGVLPIAELPNLYNRVSAGLSFSLTNYSLAPTEMMACGLPLVELDGDNTRSVFTHDENVILANPDPNSVSEALYTLLTDDEHRNRIANGALTFAQNKKWEDILKGIEEWVITTVGKE